MLENIILILILTMNWRQTPVVDLVSCNNFLTLNVWNLILVSFSPMFSWRFLKLSLLISFQTLLTLVNRILLIFSIFKGLYFRFLSSFWHFFWDLFIELLHKVPLTVSNEALGHILIPNFSIIKPCITTFVPKIWCSDWFLIFFNN